MKRNDLFFVKIWRNQFSKISTLIHPTSNQDPTDANEFKDINLSLIQRINHASVYEGDNTDGCENPANVEIKCSICGSTNLIKIPNHDKAMLFLGDVEENLEPVKIRSRRGKDRSNKLMAMWWCLDCKRLC